MTAPVFFPKKSFLLRRTAHILWGGVVLASGLFLLYLGSGPLSVPAFWGRNQALNLTPPAPPLAGMCLKAQGDAPYFHNIYALACAWEKESLPHYSAGYGMGTREALKKQGVILYPRHAYRKSSQKPLAF